MPQRVSVNDRNQVRVFETGPIGPAGPGAGNDTPSIGGVARYFFDSESPDQSLAPDAASWYIKFDSTDASGPVAYKVTIPKPTSTTPVGEATRQGVIYALRFDWANSDLDIGDTVIVTQAGDPIHDLNGDVVDFKENERWQIIPEWDPVSEEYVVIANSLAPSVRIVNTDGITGQKTIWTGSVDPDTLGDEFVPLPGEPWIEASTIGEDP